MYLVDFFFIIFSHAGELKTIGGGIRVPWTLFLVVIYTYCLSCFLICLMQHCGHLLGKG